MSGKKKRRAVTLKDIIVLARVNASEFGEHGRASCRYMANHMGDRDTIARAAHLAERGLLFIETTSGPLPIGYAYRMTDAGREVLRSIRWAEPYKETTRGTPGIDAFLARLEDKAR